MKKTCKVFYWPIECSLSHLKKSAVATAVSNKKYPQILFINRSLTWHQPTCVPQSWHPISINRRMNKSLRLQREDQQRMGRLVMLLLLMIKSHLLPTGGFMLHGSRLAGTSEDSNLA